MANENALIVVQPITVGDSATFARASTGTYVGSDGLIKTATTNEARFQYDPITSNGLGLVIESAATNLFTYSEQFDNAAWVKSSLTVTPNLIVSPDGATTADKLIESATSAEHYADQNLSVVNGTKYVFSVFAKAGERNILKIRTVINFPDQATSFNLTSGAITNGHGTGNAGIVQLANGWFRCWVLATASGTGSAVLRLQLYNSSHTYLGNGTSGIYVWGAQLETGSKATSYIPTTTAAATRAADVITGSGLVYSNVAETDYSVWSSATTYALAARVILTSSGTHKIYESLQASNLNHDPLTSPLWWVEVSPTNRWCAFDTSVSTQTKQSTTINYSVSPGQAVNTVAALNIYGANSLTVTMSSALAGGTVYTKTVDLTSTPSGSDWWAWFYATRTAPTQAILTDLPSYSDAVISFSFSGGAGLAVGVIMLGRQQAFGVGINYGARVGIQDYSRKEKNDFGDTVLVQRAFAKRANFDMQIAKAEVDSFQNFLSDVRAKPCLWIGSTVYESTTIFGFYKNFDILISYPTFADCSLELEGLT